MSNSTHRFRTAAAGAVAVLAVVIAGIPWLGRAANDNNDGQDRPAGNGFGAAARQLINQGRQTFRFDAFGDESFWGDTLKLHEAIEGSKFGGVGPGVSPRTAAAVGLKIDADALPQSLAEQVRSGQVNLDDPATTLALLKLNAVVGVTGNFNPDGSLKSIGIQCAFCHSTVDQSFKTPSIPPGIIGKRLDGWANRDLNVGAIVSLAPDLSAVAKVLNVDEPTVRKVLAAWGPGKFDAELLLDGKGFRPDGNTAAALIPPAFGLAGVNLHTWTGWGSIPYWNAFVANIEMHGKGRFFDPRLNDPLQFPVAARNGFGNLNPTLSPDEDRITPKLPALHFYQLSLAAPKSPFPDDDAAKRGDKLFSGKAKCNACHMEPLWTDAGWNMHKGADVCIDDFQADRAPDHAYRTAPLGGLFSHMKGGFYHDGRFPTLQDVVNHYDGCMNLGLTESEKQDLIAYLMTL